MARGSMIVWDRGHWEPEGDPQKGLAKGHLAFTLDGSRLKGRWHLVRVRPRSGEKTEPWLLIKSDDEFGRHVGDLEITDEVTTSQLSGRTNEELAAAGEVRKDHAARAKSPQREKLSFRSSANFPALERDYCRFSSSRAWRLSAKSLRPARNGSMRSNTTATACKHGSTSAPSVC